MKRVIAQWAPTSIFSYLEYLWPIWRDDNLVVGDIQRVIRVGDPRPSRPGEEPASFVSFYVINDVMVVVGLAWMDDKWTQVWSHPDFNILKPNSKKKPWYRRRLRLQWV